MLFKSNLRRVANACPSAERVSVSKFPEVRSMPNYRIPGERELCGVAQQMRYTGIELTDLL